MTAFEETIEWTAKGAVSTPTMFLTASVSWDAKGAVEVTSESTYLETIEWTAKGSFVPPHAFIFIDLR